MEIVGASGARADEPGHDLTYQAEAGLVTGLDLPPTLFADMAGSVMASEAVLLWRKDARDGGGRMTVTARLAMRTREARGAASAALLEMIEGLAIAEQRQSARSFALLAAQDAA